MRRLLADRLVLASAVVVVLMSALFAFLRVTGETRGNLGMVGKGQQSASAPFAAPA